METTSIADGSRPLDLKHRIVIVGGGAAGITVAAELKRRDARLDIAIVEPSDTHSYQPGWTLVGAGVFTRRQTQRAEERLIPKGVAWIRAAVTAFEPEANCVRLSDGRRLGYDYLVACPGLKLGSGLIDQIQKMTATAMQMAEKKVWAHRSYRVAMRRQSLSLANRFSTLWRWR